MLVGILMTTSFWNVPYVLDVCIGNLEKPQFFEVPLILNYIANPSLILYNLK